MSKQAAIVVLYFNKERLTVRCVRSILASGYEPHRVYCFDNGSKPEVFAGIRDTFPLVNHGRSEENSGYAGGFNRALAWVFCGPFSSALFCTNDTLVLPGALEECQKTAARTGAGLVAPRITYLLKQEEIDSIGAYFDEEACTIRHYRVHDLPDLLIPGQDYIPGTAWWIDRAAFQALGGADESYFTYWEDVDLSFRAHRQNIKLARCYPALIRHGVGQTCHKKPLYTTFYFQRNRIRFCKRFLAGERLKRSLAIIGRELEELGQRWQKQDDRQRLAYLKEIQAELVR